MKNKIYIFSIGLLFLPLIGSSQMVFKLTDMAVDTSNKIKFGVRSEAYSNSSALTARATNAGLFGGYITPEEKQFMLDRATYENNTGNFFNTSVYFAKRIDSIQGSPKSNLSFFLNISDRQEAYALFSENLLKLALYGNKQFAGENVEYSPLDFYQYHYNQFQFGFNKMYSNNVKLGIGVSFLYGQTNRRGTSPELSIFTSETGDQFSGTAKILIHQSDPNNTQYLAYNGAGASVDVFTEFPIHFSSDSSNPAKFMASISDLGMINWNASADEIRIDTTFVYQGVEVENVFDPNSNLINSNPSDYLDSLSTKTKVGYTTVLPFTVYLQLNQALGKSTFTGGFSLRQNAYYAPFFYGKYGYSLNSKLDLIAQLNYGGYGNFGGGLEVKYDSKNVNLRLGATNVEGFINPSKWAGESIYVLVGFKI